MATALRAPEESSSAIDDSITAHPICWKNEGGVFVPNEQPIHINMDGVSKDLTVETACRLIAQLTEAVEQVADVHHVIDAAHIRRSQSGP